MVHNVTIPCSESLLVSSPEGTVVVKVPNHMALGILLLLLGVVFYLPTCLGSFDILLPVCISMLFEVRDYFTNGCLLPSPLWHMSLHLLYHPVICIGID